MTLLSRFVKTRIVFPAHNRAVKVALGVGLLAVAVRFIGINQPFIDDWSWRQSDVASIARNFYLNGFHFAYPQIDWAGDQPGYVGTEFPILPFLAALCYGITGMHEWVGRVQAVVLFAISLPFFFLLVRKFFDETAACWALFFYSFAPLEIMASRCFMPDVPSLSLSIAGLYLFVRWAETDRPWLLFCSALLTALALLIKLPNAMIGVPLAAVAFERFGFSAFRRMSLWIFGAISLVPSVLWYAHAYRVAQQFYPHHFFGAGGVHLEPFGWYWRIVSLTIVTSLTVLLTLLSIPGILVYESPIRPRLFRWWGGAMIVFLIVVGYGNRHPWYQLPFVPITAAFAGNFCSMAQRAMLKRSFAFAGIALTIIFDLLVYAGATSFYRETASDLRELGLELKRSTPVGSLVVAADYGDPTVFYYAERRGWHFMEKGGMYNGHPADADDAVADLKALRSRGATHVVFYSGTLWWLGYYKELTNYLSQTAVLQASTPVYKIYRFQSESP